MRPTHLRVSRACLPSLLLILAACRSQPVPLAALAGSTITLAVGGDAQLTEEHAVGYGGTLLSSLGVHDDQRGTLRFVLRDPGGVQPDVALEPRLVTRLYPDPASEIGLHNRVLASTGLATAQFGIGQVVAVIDVPCSVPTAVYDVVLERVRRTSATQLETLDAIPYGYPGAPHRIEIVDDPNGCASAPTPEIAQMTLGTPGEPGSSEVPFTATAAIAELYPYPKLVLHLPTSPSVAAARIVVDYDATKLAIKGVIEDQHFGRTSTLLTRHDSQSNLVIDFVDPAASVKDLAIVFDPLGDYAAGAVTASDFTVVAGSVLYDGQGQPIAGSVVKGPIR